MQEIFQENPVYSAMAFLGTIIYIIKMILLLVGGDMDADSDLTTIDDGVDMDGGTTFSLISIQSILAFFMGTGWTGLAALYEWELDSLATLGTAVGVGFIFLVMSAFLTFKIKSLNHVPKINLKDAQGKTGRTYTTIPAQGEGVGQVEVTVGGKQQILQAMSSGSKIESFTAVKIDQVDDSGNLIVSKV
jgi:hypothetical protein